MSDTCDGERIPVLYSIHHCYYDRYLNDADVLELADETIKRRNFNYQIVQFIENSVYQISTTSPCSITHKPSHR